MWKIEVYSVWWDFHIQKNYDLESGVHRIAILDNFTKRSPHTCRSWKHYWNYKNYTFSMQDHHD